MSAVVIDLNDVAPANAVAPRYDLDLIVQRLRETAETWVPRLFPNGKRVGDEWRLANIRGEPRASEGNLQFRGSPTQVTEIIGRGEPGEPGEPLSTLTHTRAHAHAKEDTGKGSPGSPGSPTHVKSMTYIGEPPGEPPTRGSRGSPIPDWLRELDP